jgi:hypothetical protein
MTERSSKIVNRAIANDSAIRMQRDSVKIKGPANPNTPNPFVQPQVVTTQTQTSPVSPAGTQQKQS